MKYKQHIYHPQALCVMGKPARKDLVEHCLARMAKRGVAEVMAEGNGFGEHFIELEGLGHCPGNLGNLQGVREAGPVMIAGRRKENLCLMLEAPEGLGVCDTIPVYLESRSDFTRLLGD